ncbi:MAG: FtsQ-type POTRA domain-containing protein [Myxococcota bacterium]|nr:FtsQ-type POTRA domain-containing protein [Myxococcota bacterium]
MTKHPTLWARAAEDRRWTTVVLAVLCIALVAWTFRVAVGGSLFRLQKIEVVGVGEPHAELVRVYAAEPSGQYLWRIQEQRVAQRVRLIPWARAVRVHKIWPDRLRVTVRRDEAVAQAVIEGRLVELSAHGRMIGLRQSATDQPLVQGVDDAASRKMAMAARRGFNAVRSEEELSELRVHELGVSVYDRQGVEYRLGRDRFESRLRKAERVRHNLDKRRVRYNQMILDDERRPNRVVVRRGT